MTKRHGPDGGMWIMALVVIAIVGILGYLFINQAEQYQNSNSGSILGSLQPSIWAFIAVGFVFAMFLAVILGGSTHFGRRGFYARGYR